MNALRKKHAFSQAATVEPVPRAGAVRLVAIDGKPTAPAAQAFPQRPELDMLNETIPLFHICQNRHGFWVARDAERRAGGLFLRKRSALSFVQRQSAPTGYAIMLLDEPVELDIENQGNRFVALLGATIDLVQRRAPLAAEFTGMVIAEWRKLIAQMSAAFAGAREHRAAAERELFHGQHWLSSKSDDDLPIV